MIFPKENIHGVWEIVIGSFYANIEISPSGSYHMSFLNSSVSRIGEMMEAHWGDWRFEKVENSDSFFLIMTPKGAYPRMDRNKICWPEGEEDYTMILIRYIDADHMMTSTAIDDVNFFGLIFRASSAAQVDTAKQPVDAQSLPASENARSHAPAAGAPHAMDATGVGSEAAAARPSSEPPAVPTTVPPEKASGQQGAAADAEKAPERSREDVERERRDLAAREEIRRAEAALEMEKMKAEAARRDQELERVKQERLLDLERRKKEAAIQSELQRIKAQTEADDRAAALAREQIKNAGDVQAWQTYQDINNRRREAMNKTHELFMRTIR